MSKYSPKKDAFIANAADGVGYTAQISEKFTEHISFSFQFLDISQGGSKDFRGLKNKQLYELCDKLKEYSKNTFSYWGLQQATKNSRIFAEYGTFPEHSRFVKPKQVPIDVKWGRFRINSTCRLCGFTIDPIVIGTRSFTAETFYIVFIDDDHNFYPIEER